MHSKTRCACVLTELYNSNGVKPPTPDPVKPTPTPEPKPEVKTDTPKEKPLARKIEQKNEPLLKQYREMKKKHPDAILLFRVGDFYEIFGKDAIVASEILGLTLTRRRVVLTAVSSWRDFPTMPSTPICPNLCGRSSCGYLRAT